MTDRYSTITREAAALLANLADQPDPEEVGRYWSIHSIGGAWSPGAKDLAYAALLSVRKEFRLEDFRKMYAAAAEALLTEKAGR